MRKKILVVTIVAFSVLMIVCVVWIEHNSKSPKERYLETLETTSNQDADGSTASESVPKAPATIINDTHTVEYKILSYDLIDDVDIASQTKYPGKYFRYSLGGPEGQTPDPNYLRDYTDFDAMARDYPVFELARSTNCERGMTWAEMEEFVEEHKADYTTIRHPKTKYLFLHCIITNISSDEWEECINDLFYFAVRGDSIVGKYRGFPCYFDHSIKASHGGGVWYAFEEGESIECVIGIDLIEDFFDFSEENEYYIGFIPESMEDVDVFDLTHEKWFVSLANVPRET